MTIQVRRNVNEGHGHVFLRPDNGRTRCGGPGICNKCSLDFNVAIKMKEQGALVLGAYGVFDVAPAYKPEVSPTPSAASQTYEDAFYQIAKVLGIGAQPSSPQKVFEEQMLPKIKQAMAVFEGQEPMQFLYENHRGERNIRHVLPIRTYYGTTEHYPDPCYLLEAFDKDRDSVRTFSMAHIVMHLGR